ncbi:hypothetical protein GDO81_011923 [Engystomops pustulosus]|uniref:Uncharacterized protein n=1 Tax=Engystomops pustulosus TaxID=76066 RepID=A0AAV7BHP8_ENGPU|nr:hypothetical protein GDO81_011923 [Engystomops pustulosus]
MVISIVFYCWDLRVFIFHILFMYTLLCLSFTINIDIKISFPCFLYLFRSLLIPIHMKGFKCIHSCTSKLIKNNKCLCSTGCYDQTQKCWGVVTPQFYTIQVLKRTISTAQFNKFCTSMNTPEWIP